MTFKKYNSIDNHYQTKEIMRWLSEYPELENETFVLTEKVDGANIQLYFTPDGGFKYGKRSAFLSPEEKFFDLHELVAGPYKCMIDELSAYSKTEGKTVRLFGEIYGPGVQKRIEYLTNYQRLIFFDIMIDDKFLSYADFTYLVIRGLGIPMVPYIKTVTGLQAALSEPRDFVSYLAASDHAEGYVIKPYIKEYFKNTGDRFILKAKSDKFAEKMKVEPKERKELPEKVMEAYLKFQSYITENRLDNVVGNNGPLESVTQIGDYIRFMLDDMKKDFKADGFEETSFEPDELKQIYNVGHKIVPIIKKRIQNAI